MNKIYYLGHFIQDFEDGGQSRNKAFLNYFKQKEAIILNVYDKNTFIRLFRFVSCLWIFIFSKSNVLFISQGPFLALFPLPLLKYSFVRKNIFKLIKRTAFRNKMTIEINDLLYEQSIDLELEINITNQLFEDCLFSLKNCKFIFASNEMEKYVRIKYNLEKENTITIINGGNKLKCLSLTNAVSNCLNNSKLKFVYAGSLNRGRQIEDLISLFKDRDELLVLIGEWGEWINETEVSKNILYLGKFAEPIAQNIVSKCDVGIIPYDENRFYYNLCYPTKASFYITAGIPFLSTPLLELKNVFENSNIAFFEHFSNWASFIEMSNLTVINEYKENIINQKDLYYWDSLINDRSMSLIWV